MFIKLIKIVLTQNPVSVENRKLLLIFCSESKPFTCSAWRSKTISQAVKGGIPANSSNASKPKRYSKTVSNPLKFNMYIKKTLAASVTTLQSWPVPDVQPIAFHPRFARLPGKVRAKTSGPPDSRQNSY